MLVTVLVLPSTYLHISTSLGGGGNITTLPYLALGTNRLSHHQELSTQTPKNSKHRIELLLNFGLYRFTLP